MSYTNGLDKPTDYFEAKLYTGNESNLNITGLDFAPNLVWIKDRTTDHSNCWYDSVRGVQKRLQSNNTEAEGTDANGVTAFNSDGFTIGNSSSVNQNNDSFVSWNWKAGTSVSGTTSGSGTGKAYTGSVSTDAGFSIIKYLGNGTAGHTIPHHLGAVPKFIIVKQTIGGAENWFNYHVSLGNTKDIHLNQTNAAATADSWNDTTPTSSVFSISDQSAVNGNGNTHVAYCFAEKQGYSKFGSYTGNGNADGTFVYTGFKPAFLMVKRSSATEDWEILDNKRLGYNGANKQVRPNTNAAENDYAPTDFVSNGFKFRSANASINGSGTYIFMAFAENPFVTSTGIPTTAR